MSRLFIIPTGNSESTANAPISSIIALPHPSTAVPTRYLVTRSPLAIHELTIIDHPAPHSTLISHPSQSGSDDTSTASSPASETSPTEQDTGSVISSAQMHIATPVTPFLFLLRVLLQHEPQYRTWDDISDCLQLEAPAYRHILALLESGLDKVTDTVEPAAGLRCYRLSREKLFRTLSSRIARMANNLPAILTKTHVTNMLAPVRFDERTPDEMYDRAKRQVAIAILAGYLPASLAKEFVHKFESEKRMLDEFVSGLEKARAQEMMRQMMAAGAGNGKRRFEDEDGDETSKNKKKNANASNGVRKLKKADTTGMSKLTAFFAKK
ncbi:ribonuclease H2, subunit B [Lipomyces tetrasporus]|uniref:Ribonuclease H2 subunit B n=1 Tax=Lipomyces tetrasporus TaxID=54092 RepID=A0AAD7QKA8_9ASCO|nr:ribonuclease H2, subunit B [Lipomyces tetrasporus]KAJ8096823.1 ribonuclease H2, subunit B [Lipomyces tetrasporus]